MLGMLACPYVQKSGTARQTCARSHTTLSASVVQMVAVRFKSRLGPPGLNWKISVFYPKGLKIRKENKCCCFGLETHSAIVSAKNVYCKELFFETGKRF